MSFSILVNIYGSKEMFINEYRQLLAERLLQTTDYNTTGEVVCVCVCTRACTCTLYMCVRVCVCMYMCVCVCMYMCVYVCVSLCVHGCIHAHVTVYCMSVIKIVMLIHICVLALVFEQVYNLELLKLKFGETNLNFCEVMIKDVADSRRINTSLQQTTALSDPKVLRTKSNVASQYLYSLTGRYW